VRKRAEFERVQSSGVRVNTERFVFVFAPSVTTGETPERDAEPTPPLGSARLGITASRRIGGAVVRNRAKRLVREAFRALSELFPAGLDLVVIVRKPLGDRKLAAVLDEWRGAAPALKRRTGEALARAAGGGKTAARP
jgi:ribonuclease P protein component